MDLTQDPPPDFPTFPCDLRSSNCTAPPASQTSPATPEVTPAVCLLRSPYQDQDRRSVTTDHRASTRRTMSTSWKHAAPDNRESRKSASTSTNPRSPAMRNAKLNFPPLDFLPPGHTDLRDSLSRRPQPIDRQPDSPSQSLSQTFLQQTPLTTVPLSTARKSQDPERNTPEPRSSSPSASPDHPPKSRKKSKNVRAFILKESELKKLIDKAVKAGRDESKQSATARNHARKERKKQQRLKFQPHEDTRTPQRDGHPCVVPPGDTVNPPDATPRHPSPGHLAPTPDTPPSNIGNDLSLDSTGTFELSPSHLDIWEDGAPSNPPPNAMAESRNRCGSVYNHHPNGPRPMPSCAPWPELEASAKRPPARELSPNSIAECHKRSLLPITTTNITTLDMITVVAAEHMGRRRTEYIFVREPSTPQPLPRSRTPRRNQSHSNRPADLPPQSVSPLKPVTSTRPTQQPARKPAAPPAVMDGNPDFEPSPPPRRTATRATTPPASPAKPTRRPLVFPKATPGPPTHNADTACAT